MMTLTSIDRYLEEHLEESIAELSRFCEQPSVSAQNWGIEDTARMVEKMLKKRGFETHIIPTAGAPVVTAFRAGKSPRTLLFYNHYDVQPPEPLELWESPPFQPTLRDGKLFARGVSDDKGHLLSRLFAIDAILAEYGELPCNIRFVVEGEEEIGSPNLKPFMEAHASNLQADACIWEFGGVDHRDVPVQYLGLRGLCYVELRVETANQDVHSGLGGSIFPNAAWRLVWALNTLKSPDETILLAGFYDKVRPPSKRDLELFELMPETADEYRNRYGIKEFLKGMTGGVELRVAESMLPTCTICGLTSGYQGPGSKTVLPARASAKVDFRLVPDQTPEDVLHQLRQHLDNHGFSDVQITYLGGEAPARTDVDHPFVKMVVESAAEVYGRPMQIIPMSGGSGPNHLFMEMLHVPIVTAGIGHPGSQAHAPNENIRLDLYLKGAKHIARILVQFGLETTQD
ncbi:M20/M25/M40 family metallo-hydrolase [Bellilinea sp.]|uniref:M20/M25/M40 family metallo-hydrolase n=1 Tax=Bellilinea sp. TaxID=2838785 RepID=UPI002ADD5468|nr:M20/M25/M40 family metallo-hydrolase [Bellilinea sp.]